MSEIADGRARAPFAPVPGSYRGCIYLAAKYSRRLEMLDRYHELEEIGYAMKCRWVLGEHEADDENIHRAGQFGEDDRADLDLSTIVIAFNADIRAESRGGNHVEFGYALGKRKRLFLVGIRGNVFHYLPEVTYFATWEECLEYLKPTDLERSRNFFSDCLDIAVLELADATGERSEDLAADIRRLVRERAQPTIEGPMA